MGNKGKRQHVVIGSSTVAVVVVVVGVIHR